MDIVKVLTLAHLKASFGTLKLKQKFYLLVFILALLVNLVPHKTHAFTIKAPTAPKPILFFDTNDKSYLDVLAALNSEFINLKAKQRSKLEAEKLGLLGSKLRVYLEARKSPLANYAGVLVRVPHWKKIVALANAESSLCRFYPEELANCWGVGGSNMWDMGNSLGDGVIAMNKFLEQYPLRSKTKYSHMTFKQMNGLYKQPAAKHWQYNAQVIYDDLSVLEKSVN